MILTNIGSICLLFSAFFALTASLGILRFPDLYTRMHAASKAGTLASGFALLAIAFIADGLPIILRAIAGILFFLLTAPISAHLLARAALISGNVTMRGTIDEGIEFDIDEEEKNL